MYLACAVAHELPSHKRLVVGIGKSEIAAFVLDFKCKVGKFNRCSTLASHVVFLALRD